MICEEDYMELQNVSHRTDYWIHSKCCLYGSHENYYVFTESHIHSANINQATVHQGQC